MWTHARVILGALLLGTIGFFPSPAGATPVLCAERSFLVTQAPTDVLTASVASYDGPLVDFYGYGEDLPFSASFAGGGVDIAREDALVLFTVAQPGGDPALGLVFDAPLRPPEGRSISNATGGSAGLLLVGTPLVPLVVDDPEDAAATSAGPFYGWDWLAGETDGALFSLGASPGCVTIVPAYLHGVERVLFYDAGLDVHIELTSVNRAVTVCPLPCCTPTGEEQCDGVDNDCDGLTDEDLAEPATSCGLGACAASGVLRCVDGALVDTCTPQTEVAEAERCDGVDNDCDGEVDEALSRPVTCGVGACQATGTSTCVAGAWETSCEPGPPGPDNDCDGVDDDCDGTADEHFVAQPVVCGEGQCEAWGSERCVAGALSSDCVPGAPTAEQCDGVDNDCDGETDEGIAGLHISVFQAPTQAFSVSAIAGTVSAEEYYGYGQGASPRGAHTVDRIEALNTLVLYVYEAPDASLSLGIIADAPAMAREQMTGGQAEVDVIGPGLEPLLLDDPEEPPKGPLGTHFGWVWGGGETDGVVLGGLDGVACVTVVPAYLDGIDTVAVVDGATLEHIPLASASAPVTLCTESCCVPDGPERCDGLDNDCDGLVDEELGTRSCGVGACATSVPACIDGVPQLCEPLASTPEACDGVDNDCDGLVDEYLGMLSCGEGDCRSTVPACVAGVPQSCLPGIGAPELCDGYDNDCDGAVDEGCSFTWSEFVATASEIEGLPSVDERSDTRAGSLEINLNGDWGFARRQADPPREAGILTLRDGRGVTVEALQIGRRWVPDGLDEFGCEPETAIPVCWMDLPDSGTVEAALPEHSGGSNDGFDLSGERVEVEGRVTFELDGGTPPDNAHETMLVTWRAPRGLYRARLQLRGRYDWNLDGLDATDPWVPLFRQRWTGDGDDLLIPFAEIVEETNTVLTIRLNAEDALYWVRWTYDESGLFDAGF